jgi:hypothetical protein
MSKLWCLEGEHEVKVAFQPSAGERFCPTHGVHLQPLPKKPSGLGARRESTEETAARQHFNREVTAERCFYSEEIGGEKRRPGHECTYPLDAHHIIEKQWIRREFGDLPKDELLAILFVPAIGAPLCRGGHENVKRLRILWHEVSDACKLFCRWVDDTYGDSHPSMYERLKLECGVKDYQSEPERSLERSTR